MLISELVHWMRSKSARMVVYNILDMILLPLLHIIIRHCETIMRVILCTKTPSGVPADAYKGTDFSSMKDEKTAIISPDNLDEWQPEYIRSLSEGDTILQIQKGLIRHITSIGTLWILLPSAYIKTMLDDKDRPLGDKVEFL